MVQDVQPKLTNGNVQAIMGKPTTKRRILSPASIWDELTLFPWLESRGIKTIHAHRIWKHLLKSGAKTLDNIEDVPDLPALLVGELKKDFVLSTSKVAPPLSSHHRPNCHAQHRRRPQTRPCPSSWPSALRPITPSLTPSGSAPLVLQVQQAYFSEDGTIKLLIELQVSGLRAVSGVQ
jgi:hypothetical protein